MSFPVSIKGVLLDGERVALLENERGEWELPGGRLEAGEDPPACLVREFAEELGVEVVVDGPLDCWVYEVLPQRRVVIVTYAVRRRGAGELRVSAEHRRCGWFAVGELERLAMPQGYRRSIRARAGAAESEPLWLTTARELQAIAQTGLSYETGAFDVQRYERIREIAAVMMAAGSATPVEKVLDLFRQDLGHATPHIGVRGAAFCDDRVLLVRETHDGKWALPGGWAEVNQTARQSVEREVFEETGFTVRATKLAAVWDRRRIGAVPIHPVHVIKLWFLCEITGGAARPSLETSEVGFFAEGKLPELSPGRSNEAQVRRLFEHRRRPDLPTDFD